MIHTKQIAPKAFAKKIGAAESVAMLILAIFVKPWIAGTGAF